MVCVTVFQLGTCALTPSSLSWRSIFVRKKEFHPVYTPDGNHSFTLRRNKLRPAYVNGTLTNERTVMYNNTRFGKVIRAIRQSVSANGRRVNWNVADKAKKVNFISRRNSFSRGFLLKVNRGRSSGDAFFKSAFFGQTEKNYYTKNDQRYKNNSGIQPCSSPGWSYFINYKQQNNLFIYFFIVVKCSHNNNIIKIITTLE